MDQFKTIFDGVYVYGIAIAISVPRILALFAILPIMSRIGLPVFLQTVIAVAISLPIVIPLVPHLSVDHPLSPFAVGILCLKEAFVGLLLGIVIGVPFFAIEVAGNVVDFVRQAPDAEVQDPQGTTDASITGTLFSIFATLYFLSMGGIGIIADILYRSYDIWPALSNWPSPGVNATSKALAILDQILRSAIVLGAPLIIFILLAFIILIIVVRFTPQINVFDLSMSFRNVAFLIAIQIYALYIISYFSLQTSHIGPTLDVLKGFFNEQ